MNAYSLPKGTISRVLVASGTTRHDCLFQRFIANDIKCINLLVKNLTLNLALFALLFIQTILNHETLTWISVIALLIISFLVELAWRKKNKRNLH